MYNCFSDILEERASVFCLASIDFHSPCNHHLADYGIFLNPFPPTLVLCFSGKTKHEGLRLFDSKMSFRSFNPEPAILVWRTSKKKEGLPPPTPGHTSVFALALRTDYSTSTCERCYFCLFFNMRLLYISPWTLCSLSPGHLW